MQLPSLSNLSSPLDELAAVRQRLLAVKASLVKACQELDTQIQALENVTTAVSMEETSPTPPSLFESEPVPPVDTPSASPAPTTKAVSATESLLPTKSVILEAKGPVSVDPNLEQATLEELNKALSKAFAQISSRHPWAG